MDGACGAEVSYNNQTFLTFCSNDYLGLCNHPQVIAALKRGIEKFGAGSGASQLVSGYYSVHQQLEEALAEFLGRSKVLLFSSGYLANLGVVDALLGRHDHVLLDREIHASLNDATRLCGAKRMRFEHNNMVDLEQHLQGLPSEGARLVATEGIFSMSGECAPLTEAAELAERYRALLMVDEAHALGCYGASGQGVTRHLELSQDKVPLVMGTLSKAFGLSGAFVAGDEQLIEMLIQYCRTSTYSTALAPGVAMAALTALEIICNESWRRQHLQLLIQQFRQGAEQLGLNCLLSDTPIQAVICGDNHTALACANALEQKGILVIPMRPPTVLQGTSRLRISLSAAHQPEHIERLLEALASLDV